MKKTALALLAAAATAATANAQIIYLTGQGSNIRRSTDNGATFANWVTGGSQFAGITVDSSNNVLVFDRDSSIRRIYAVNPTVANGTSISSAQTANVTATTGGTFGGRPISFYNGRVYLNADGLASSQNTALFSWNGSSFGSQTDANFGNWTANDMTFINVGGTDYGFVSGTSGTTIRRATLNTSGVATSTTTVSFTGLGGSNIQDFLFTPSGRWMVLTEGGIYLSANSSITSTSVSVSSILSFSGTETPSTGDMGNLGREIFLFNGVVYGASNQNLYRYTYDDALGTLSFITGSNVAHGLNTAALQLVVVPEPGTLALVAGGLAGLWVLRRRRAV